MGKQWTVRMSLTYTSHVTVQADSEEEARRKADKVEWVDDGMNGSELIDWDVTGEPRED